MKIVQLCLTAPYTDGMTYQENLLSKYLQKLGHENEIISYVFPEKKGHFRDRRTPVRTENEFGMPAVYLRLKRPAGVCRVLRRFYGLYEVLEKAAPEMIFLHGPQFMDADQVVRYVKSHPKVRLLADSHADLTNSGRNWFSRHILHRFLWRNRAKLLLPFTETFYGVLPARVDFLREEYRLPDEKCELLLLAADDDRVREAGTPEFREMARQKYGLTGDEFVIVTGGKINQRRLGVLHLMQAVASMPRKNLRLLVFGRPEEGLKERFQVLSENERIRNLGWISSDETYALFAAADLLIFPGRMHSVLWEQAVAQGKPCVFRRIPGETHVDLGGNAVFLEEASEEELTRVLTELLEHPEKLDEMRRCAEEKGRQVFSYLETAKRIIRDPQE